MCTRESRAWLLCTILVCAGNCNSQQKPAAGKIQPENPGNALALSKAMEHFSAHWQQCGDSYVSIVPSDNLNIPNDFSVTEIKGVRPYLPSGVNQPLTEADRLNGFSWKGMVFFDYVAVRHFLRMQHTALLPFGVNPDEVNRWGEWHPASWKQDHGISQEGYWWLEVTEKNGQWQVKPSSLDAESSGAAKRRKLDCSKVSLLGQSGAAPAAAPEGLQPKGGSNVPNGVPIRDEVRLAALPCPRFTRSLHSGTGATPTAIRFVGSKQRARIYWMDAGGHPKFYHEIQPSEEYVQQTLSTHVWLVTSTSGSCVAVFVAGTQPMTTARLGE